MIGCHDECRLFTLYETYVGVRPTAEKVLTKEALIECPVGWQQSYPNERNVRPTLKTLTVTIVAVVHDMATVNLLLTVYLPEYDIASLCGTNEVVIIDTAYLLRRECKLAGNTGGEPLPENTIRRMATSDILHGQWLEGRQWRGSAVAFH